MSQDDSWAVSEEVSRGPPGLDQKPQLGSVYGGRFRLEAELGAGAMGAVYRARDLDGDRDVALKLLRRMRSQNAARLLREGELTARLEHPGIVRIHQAGEADGVPYLVYELVPGAVTLADAAAGMSRADRVQALRQVAEAVAHAHERGVVHRDLKAGNVLLGEDGRVRVADFGLAWGARTDTLTQSGAIVGTPRTMSPEQLRGLPSGREVTVDVWALGVMLYRALTDTYPFQASTLPQLRAQVCEGKPTPPRALEPSVEPELEAVCLAALEKDPARRPPDAGAFLAALDAALAGRAPKRGRTGRGAVIGGAAALALLLLLLAGVLAERSAPASPESTGPSEATVHARVARGESAAALRAAADLVALRPRDAGALDLLVRLHLAAGDPDAAASALERGRGVLPPALADVRRAEIRCANGADPEVALGPLVTRWTAESAPRLALARWLLAREAEPRLASAALGALAADAPKRQAFVQVCELLAAPRPETDSGAKLAKTLADVPCELRAAVARYLLVVGRRDARFVRCALDPKQRGPADGRAIGLGIELSLALAPAERERRARRALQACSLLALDPAVRSEASGLLAELDAPAPAPGPPLDDPERASGRALFLDLRRRKARVEAMAAGCERVLERDPLSPEAQFFVARRKALEDSAGIRDMVEAVSRGPYLLSLLLRNLFAMGSVSRSTLIRGESLLAIVERMNLGDSPAELLLRSFALVTAVEYEGRLHLAPAALELLDRLLTARPEEATAWVLRAALHLRAGRLLRAERDLRVAREVLDGEGCLLFYEGVLLAARGAPAPRVRERLQQALRAGFEVWGEQRWRPALHPPLLRYHGQPGFEMLEPH